MNSLVLDLQAAAYNSVGTTSDLVRKAYFVARKLKVKDFQEWLSKELNGYSATDINIIPDYRKTVGTLKAFNEYRGWIPALIGDKDLLNRISTLNIFQSIGELEKLSQEEYLTARLPDDVVIQLGQLFNFSANYRLFIGTNQAFKVIDTVKSIILDWSIKLEEEGIMGEGLSFTKEELIKAGNIQTQINNHFHGDVKQSQIQQNSNHSSQSLSVDALDAIQIKNLLSDIRKNQNQIEIKDEDVLLELNNRLSTIEGQLASSTPNNSVIKESMLAVKKIIEGVSSNLITSGIIYSITQLLG